MEGEKVNCRPFDHLFHYFQRGGRVARQRTADAALPHLGQGRPQRGRRVPGPRRELRRQGQQLQVR